MKPHHLLTLVGVIALMLGVIWLLVEANTGYTCPATGPCGPGPERWYGGSALTIAGSTIATLGQLSRLLRERAFRAGRNPDEDL